MTKHFNEEQDPDLDALADKVSEQSQLVDELRQWKSKISGGLFVSAWFIGGMQAVTLAVVIFVANLILGNSTMTNGHAVELASLKQKVEAFQAVGPRFTAEMNAASEAAMKAELLEYIQRSIPPKWVEEKLKEHDAALLKIQSDIHLKPTIP